MPEHLLTTSDITNLDEYFKIRDANPCLKCSGSPATCCGCKQQSEWLEKYRVSYDKIKELNPRARILYEQFAGHTQRYAQLDAEIKEAEKQIESTFSQLAGYLDAEVLSADSVNHKNHSHIT